MEIKTSVDEESKNSISTNEPIVNEIKKPTSEKIEWIVVLRAFACMAVVMLHIITLFESTNLLNKIERVVLDKVILQPFVRFAVPCFIMISGALMLDPKHNVTLSKILKKIFKLTLIYFIFGLGINLFNNYKLLWNDSNVKQWLLTSLVDLSRIFSFFNGRINYFNHMWYVVMLIGLYIITPILRKFVEYADKETVIFVLIFIFATNWIIPNKICLFGFNILNEYLFVYLLGYFVAKTNLIKELYIYLIGVIGFIGVFIACWFDNYYFDFLSFFESILIIKIFSTNKIKIKNNKIINCVSKYSLGIYLVHPFWILLISKFPYILSPFPMGIGELVFFLYALIMSLLSSMILYRLPLVKKLFKS
ncbi:MAG: acyltransferase family protein [Clostridia bacterium]|nr:acyltransferase family protein [Clostridia bacterium]